MNSDYYFQKGLRLIVTGVVVLALIILFCGMVSQGFPLWLALVLLVPAGLGVVGFYFFSLGSSADLSDQTARNRKVIKYRKRTYLFHLPNHNSGLSLAV